MKSRSSVKLLLADGRGLIATSGIQRAQALPKLNPEVCGISEMALLLLEYDIGHADSEVYLEGQGGGGGGRQKKKKSRFYTNGFFFFLAPPPPRPLQGQRLQACL